VPKLLGGLRLLILEDDYLAALDLAQMVEEQGGTVVGPVARLDQARALADMEGLDGAILDVDLSGETSLPLADELMARGVPVVLCTGYDPAMLPERFAALPRLDKPSTRIASERILRRVFNPG
jgi:DNA-binding NtrC family response regulator